MSSVPRRLLRAARDLKWARMIAGLLGIAPLLFSLAIGVILWAASFGFATGMRFAYLLVAVSVWASANYFLEVVEHKALGAAGWPVMSIDTIAGGPQQVGVLLAGGVLAVAAFVSWGFRAGHSELGWWCTAIGIAALPAVAGALGVARSPVKALDPRTLVRAAAGMKLDYPALIGASALAVAAIALAYRRRGIGELVLGSYAWSALGYLIGAVVYERRLELGVHAPSSPESRAAVENERRLRARRAALAHAYGVAAGGKLRGALGYLEQYAASEPDPLTAKVWLFHEIARWENGKVAIALGTTLVAELGNAQRHDEAAKILVALRHVEEQLKRRG
jgi:hypothetical protein